MSVPLINRGARKRAPMRWPRGPQLSTEDGGRDGEILRWIGRHGVVTVNQVARRWFGTGGGRGTGDGLPAAYRRLKALELHRLIRRESWYISEPDAIRLTAAGAAEAARTDPAGTFNLKPPPRLVIQEIRHTLGVVDLVEHLLGQNPGATVTTERELRAQWRRDLRDGTRRAGDGGRAPDGILHMPSGDDVALELDRTEKRARDYERIIQAYKRERYQRIWWFTREKAAPRLRELCERDAWAKQRIEVGVW